MVENNGLPLERPFAEWLLSPAKSKGERCQDCHMPTYDGPAAIGVPDRKGLHRHRFTSVDPALLGGDDPVDKQLIAERDALLATAASLALQVTQTARAGAQLDVSVTVNNLISGHRLPTGSTFIRQLWLRVDVLAGAKTIYTSGDLDVDGDLRDRWSKAAQYNDDDLVSFSSTLLDRDGNPTLFPWKAVEHRHASIAPQQARTATYFVPIPKATNGPLTVRAKLQFRPYPPHLLRLLGLPTAGPRVAVTTIATAEATIGVTP